MNVLQTAIVFVGIIYLLGLPIAVLFAPQSVTLKFIPFEYKAENVWTGHYLIGFLMTVGGIFLIIQSERLAGIGYTALQKSDNVAQPMDGSVPREKEN